MFVVHSPFRDMLDRTQAARDQLVRDRQKLLGELGEQLEGFAEEAIEVRSSGAAAAGIGWQPLDPDYLREKQRQGLSDKIGQATGEMVGSLGFTTSPDGVALGFTAAHAEHFALRRPLLPEALPADWQESLEGGVERWGDDILNETLTEDR